MVTGPGLRMGTAAGRWVLAATIAGSGLASLDATVVNVALARIGTEFGARFSVLQWIANAYTLTLAAFILLGGVLGDLFGRRRVFLIGVLWFAAASVLCAVSTGEAQLIAARALQGVGGALLTPGSLAIISATFAPSDRSRAIGAWSGLGGIAAAVGPFLGGWLVDLSWRLIFVVNVPVAIAVVVVARKHVPETSDRSVDGAAPRVDIVGASCVVVSLTGITYALTTAGQRGLDVPVVAAAALGLLAALSFVAVERRVRQPLIRLEMFRSRVFTTTNVVTVFVYAALAVFFFLLVLQLQVVSRWSALAAGSSLLPVTVLMLLLSARFGALSSRVGPRPLMTAGCGVAAGAFALALRIGPGASLVTEVLPAVVLLGLGLSCVVAPLTSAVLGSAPAELVGAASGINNATARSAGLLAIAVVPAWAGLSRGGVSDAVAFDHGYHTAMTVGAGLLLVGAAVSWFGVGRLAAEGPAPSVVGEPQLRVPVYRVSHCPISSPPLHPEPSHGQRSRQLP